MNEDYEAGRRRAIEMKRKMANDIHAGHYGLLAYSINGMLDVLSSRWTWRVALFIFALFLGIFLAQTIFQAGIEYGRNSCNVTELHKNK